jgi:CRP-like cAMP-binding protein
MAKVEMAQTKGPGNGQVTFRNLESILTESANLCVASGAICKRIARVIAAHDVRMSGYADLYHPPRAGRRTQHSHNWLAFQNTGLDSIQGQQGALAGTRDSPQAARTDARMIRQDSSPTGAESSPGGAPGEWARSKPARTVLKGRRIAGDLEIRSRLLMIVSGHAKLGVTRLHSGETRASLIRPKSRGRLLAFLGPGDFVSMLPRLHEGAHAMRAPSLLYSCEAVTDCLVAEVAYRDVSENSDDRDPKPEFLDHAVIRWLSVVTSQSVSADLDVRGRLLACLKGLAARFGVLCENGTSIEPPLTEGDLAKLIGASRPKISLVLSSLQREGALKKMRQHVILVRQNACLAR